MMQAKQTARPLRSNGVEPVLVLTGYGLRVAVARSHLVLEDGVGEDRRVRHLSRIDRQVKRIVVIGHAGTISLDAIRWLHDVKIPLVHLDTDGHVLALVAPDGPDHPLLRRAQAQAVDSELGLRIMRDLLRQKLDGQERLVRDAAWGQLALAQIQLARQNLPYATDMTSLRGIEGGAAGAYWTAWRRVRVSFRTSEREAIPAHWLSFGPRASALTASPRSAVNPANAILNYLYAILEAEARLALLAVGCDPGIGIQHADQRARDSLACDVMEAVRPHVDRWLLEFLGQRQLRRRDVFELRTGQCRLMPGLAKELATTVPMWRAALEPVVQRVAGMLLDHATRPERPRRWTSRRPRASTVAGARLAERLAPIAEATPLAASIAQSMGRARAGLVAPDTKPTRAWFFKEVVPALRDVPVGAMARAVGLSERYCAKVRGGRAVPHQRHWPALALVATLGEDGAEGLAGALRHLPRTRS
jgi:CRISPR-associated protein Cas1